MARPRFRSVSGSRAPWCYKNVHKGACKGRMLAKGPQQHRRNLVAYVLKDSVQPLNPSGWSLAQHLKRASAGQGGVFMAGKGPFVPFLVAPVTAPYYLYNDGNVIYMSQSSQPKQRMRRSRRSRRSRRNATQRQWSPSPVTLLDCPPAPLITNDFYMKRAEEERAAALAVEQDQSQEWICPPAPLLTNSFYMERAEQQRAEQQRAEQRLAAAVQQDTSGPAVQQQEQQQPHLELQLPSTPSNSDQLLCVTASPAASYIDTADQSISAHLSLDEGLQCAALVHEGEEEVCTWDPETLVVVESF